MAKEQPDLFKIVGRDREITAIRERLARLESGGRNLKQVSISYSLPNRRGKVHPLTRP
jgi:hypothetical protein